MRTALERRRLLTFRPLPQVKLRRLRLLSKRSNTDMHIHAHLGKHLKPRSDNLHTLTNDKPRSFFPSAAREPSTLPGKCRDASVEPQKHTNTLSNTMRTHKNSNKTRKTRLFFRLA